MDVADEVVARICQIQSPGRIAADSLGRVELGELVQPAIARRVGDARATEKAGGLRLSWRCQSQAQDGRTKPTPDQITNDHDRSGISPSSGWTGASKKARKGQNVERLVVSRGEMRWLTRGEVTHAKLKE